MLITSRIRRLSPRDRQGTTRKGHLRPTLFNDDPRTTCPVQKPLEVEAREGIVGVVADVRRKSCHRAGIAGLKLVERLHIAPGGRSLELFNAHRLE